MTTVSDHRPTWRKTVTNRTFVVHYLQMLAAMIAGMVVLGPPSMLLGHGAGPEMHVLLTATSMTVGMAAWVAWRRHPWLGIVEMGVAMYLAFVLLFPIVCSENNGRPRPGSHPACPWVPELNRRAV